MNIFLKIALFFTILGALNWGLVGIFEMDVIAEILGGAHEIGARIVYILIAICGLINIKLFFEDID